MAGRINFGKILIVAFLTVLIWVWADLAKKSELPVQNAVINVTKSADPSLLISLDGKPQVFLGELILSGPSSKISEAKKELGEGTLEMAFFYEPSAKAVESGGENFNILDYLRQNQQIKDLGLAVESCEPMTMKVVIQKLILKTLKIRCVDEGDKVIEDVSVDPATVDMYVPSNWEGSSLVADVELSENDLGRAREKAVDKRPYIELQPGYQRQSDKVVSVKAPPKEDLLKEATITKRVLGYLLTSNLVGKYDVNIVNYDAVTSPITVMATDAAKQEYEMMDYQIILKVLDNDRNEDPAKPIRRELMYNFPEKYLRKNEIKLKGQPVVAQFYLKPKAAQSPQP